MAGTNTRPTSERSPTTAIRACHAKATACHDSGATEQVFGHLKDEFFRGQDWQTFSYKADAPTSPYWNTQRRQVKLQSLTPAEYRDQTLNKPHSGYH